MNGRPSIHVHPCNSIRSSTASGSKRSTMTMGAPQLTESRKVKRPVACTIGHALSTICADSRSVSANAFASADSVVGVWVTNLGAPVVPDVVSRTAGASLSGSGGKRPATLLMSRPHQGMAPL
jgi:hypothetical protein